MLELEIAQLLLNDVVMLTSTQHQQLNIATEYLFMNIAYQFSVRDCVLCAFCVIGSGLLTGSLRHQCDGHDVINNIHVNANALNNIEGAMVTRG